MLLNYTYPIRIGLSAAAVLMLGSCGDDIRKSGQPDAAVSNPDPDPEQDLQGGSFLAPLVQQQRLQGVEDHMHVDEVRLRDDNLLFYCSYTFGIIDATNAQSMEYLSQDLKHTIPSSTRRPGCIHVSWDDTDYSIAYTTHRGNISNPPFLSGWDVTDPEAPVQIPALEEPGTHYEGIDVLGGFVYVGLRDEGLGVYTRNPLDDTLTRVATLTGFEQAWGVRARADNKVFIADGAGGLVAVDVTDPLVPVILGTVGLGGVARDVVLDGDYAYVATGSGGVVVVDVSNLASMQVATRIEMPGSAIRVAHSEGLLHVAAWNDARTYDVSTPTSPRFIGAARVTQRDDDVDPDRPESTMRIFGVAARGNDLFLGSWWVPYSFKVFPERTAPSIRLSETYTQVDFGRNAVGAHRTQPFEVINQGSEPLTLVHSSVVGPFTVEPRQMQIAPGDTGILNVTYKPTSSDSQHGFLKILSDDPAEPVRSAYLVGNLPGLSVGQVLPETNATLTDGTEWYSSDTADKVLLLAYFATF